MLLSAIAVPVTCLMIPHCRSIPDPETGAHGLIYINDTKATGSYKKTLPDIRRVEQV